jgi:hypothetical protein
MRIPCSITLLVRHILSACYRPVISSNPGSFIYPQVSQINIVPLQRREALHALANCVRFNCAQYFFGLRHQQVQIAVQYFLLDR